MNKTFQLTSDNIIAEHVDAEEKLLGVCIKFNRGTVLTIVREAHSWEIDKGIKYCTVQIRGLHFNIPASVLASSIVPKRS